MSFPELVESLDSRGFFDSIDDSKRLAIKAEILETEYLFPEELAKDYMADAEDLAERGVLEFLEELSTPLAKRGVVLPTRSEQRSPRKERDPKTGEIITVTHSVLIIDDSVPDFKNTPCLRPVTEECPDSGTHYRVTIGSRSQKIWDSSMAESTMWEAAMNHTFLLTNQLLEDAGSQERLYGLYGGNGGRAVFLTPSQFALIAQCPAIDELERPWVPQTVH